MTKEMLLAKAESLAGRPVEVEQTTDGQFIVLWMCFERPPPEKGATEEIALENFIAYMEAMKKSEPNLEEDK